MLQSDPTKRGVASTSHAGGTKTVTTSAMEAVDTAIRGTADWGRAASERQDRAV